MCGINGRFNFDGSPVSAAEITAARDIMVHRGPDDSGAFVEGPIGLGHRRLSIIDLSGGHQPLGNEDGTVTVVFNGEIYNFQELRDGLVARGHTFKTRSDTEVIAHLYEERGADCVRAFRGMFTFALWDAKQRRLLLARDRLGKKPLYYALVRNGIVFASEIKSILACPEVSAEVDPVGLRRYLAYRHSYGHGTLFAGIMQVPPGHYLSADARGTTVRQYWDVPTRDAQHGSRSEQEFMPLLEEAVKLRMISDVPLGVFLSGGLDSSVVATLMARHTQRVRTFSIGFVPGEESELKWAKRVAESCSAEHHEFEQGADDFFALLQRLVWHNDEPMTFPASIPLYILSRESKRMATVMLGGEGADELLAGYDNNVRTYRLARAAGLMPAALRKGLGRLPLPARYSAIGRRIGHSEHEMILSAFRVSDHAELARACRMPLPSAQRDDEALLAELGADQRRGTFLDRLLYFQLKTYLIALLMKNDKMSMAASIEARVPYLDHELVELAFALPDSAKVRGKVGKYWLKQASAELLPSDVIHRRKQGFPVPIAKWFRAPGNPFLDVLLDPSSLRDGLLDGDHVQARVNRFLAGEEISIELWSMLNLELWRREFVAARSVRSESRRALS